jgi:hypothetical protein
MICECFATEFNNRIRGQQNRNTILSIIIIIIIKMITMFKSCCGFLFSIGESGATDYKNVKTSWYGHHINL